MTSAELQFDGKVVVITGGGAGIGRRFAHRFAAEGGSIVVADLDPEAGQRVIQELETLKTMLVCIYRSMCVTVMPRPGWLMPQLSDSVGSMCWSTTPGSTWTTLSCPTRSMPYPAGVTSSTSTCWVRSPAPPPVMTPWLPVVAGPSSTCPQWQRTAAEVRTGVSKLALNSLTVGLAGAFADEGIRVNGIAPGLVDSESAVEWWSDPSRSAMNIQDLLINGQMIKRQGRMDDLADLAHFLGSDRASFITGQTILVDGGHTRKPY